MDGIIDGVMDGDLDADGTMASITGDHGDLLVESDVGKETVTGLSQPLFQHLSHRSVSEMNVRNIHTFLTPIV